MKLTYWGHSCFLVETKFHRLVIDPYLEAGPVKAEEVQCDFILLSHGHDDHVGSAVEISQRTGATILGGFELTEYLRSKGAKVDSMNPGGAITTPFGRLKLTLAFHSSSTTEYAKFGITYLGEPCGLLIEADGQRVYHAGDTALFLDMQLIGRGGLDAALLPIGDRFTMGPEDALEALDLLKPKVAVPMHYNTWPPIAQDAGAFARAAAARGHPVKVLAPAQSLAL